ncbi:MAG: ATP-binding protein [Planctomycetota bacterium]
MIELIKKRLLDFREDGLPPYRHRNLSVAFIKDMVTTLVGVRKSGKTYLTYQAIDDEIRKGTIQSLDQVCYLHFDDESLECFPISDMALIEKALLEINSDFFDKPCLMVFDEIHRVEQWESYALRLLRKRNTRILVTGSSSDLEEDRVGRQLRGKAFHCRVTPLSFKEYALWNGKGLNPDALSTRQEAELCRLFERYIVEGGFPGVFEIDGIRQKHHLLQSYYNSIVAADFLEEVGAVDIHVVKAFLGRLLHGNACNYFHKKMYDQLCSSGYRLTKALISSWFHQAEKSYFISACSLYARSIKKIDQNPRKPYCVDWAMANVIGNPLEVKRTRSLETIIYHELIRRGYEVSYYRDPRKKDIEVDFIAYHRFEEPELAIQVSFDVSQPDTLAREVRSLMALRGGDLSAAKRLLITSTPASQIKVDPSITVVAPVHWLLQEGSA